MEILLQKLDEIEAEMKRIGYWVATPPDWQTQSKPNEIRSYLDAPSFELWLQTFFLPHARQAIHTNTVPADSQVGRIAMRQYDYHSVVAEAHRLMQLLNEFDDLVIIRHTK